MAVKIGSNIQSLTSQRRLNQVSDALGSVYERLSSGARINKASDDTAGLAIADSLKASSRIFTRGVLNLNDGVSALTIADAALGQLSEITTRITELAEQASNGTYSSQQRKALDSEAQALKDEFFRISRSTKFNNINLFDGSLQGIRLQGGVGIDGSIFSSLGGVLGTGSYTLSASSNSGLTLINENALVDLNGDGILDQITSGAGGSASISIALGTGSGGFATATTMTFGAGEIDSISVGDINNDGIMDALLGGKESGSSAAFVKVLLGTGAGTFTSGMSYANGDSFGGFNWNTARLGDLNNDGKLDYASVDTLGNVNIALGMGDGTFVESSSFNTGNNFAPELQIADFNGDGLQDLIIGSGDAGVNRIRIYRGLGNGEVTASTSLGSSAFFRTYSIAIGDVNNDGLLDVVSAGTTSGSSSIMAVHLRTAAGSYTTTMSYIIAAGSIGSVQLVDSNGDGFLDIVASGGANVSWFNNTGNGTFSLTASTTGSTGVGLAIGDVNNDGIADIVKAGATSSQSLLANQRDGINNILSFSLKTQADALQALAPLSRKLDQINAQRGIIGAFQARITAAVGALSSQAEQAKAAESRIRDTDVASDAGDLVRLQILQQASTSVLAQANLQPQLALRLLSPTS